MIEEVNRQLSRVEQEFGNLLDAVRQHGPDLSAVDLAGLIVGLDHVRDRLERMTESIEAAVVPQGVSDG